MERESNKHSPVVDDEMKKEIEGVLRGNRPNRADESRDTEALVEDENENDQRS
ncbi:hypothetical protein [Kibdelosporangium aridum]|uniref:Uncharacterized protein n=1 Tax=Kibdelosporangium aridum TaxID=2030 RepID=A0A1Y5WRY8_KIBAR|nr:hypothetical protein [Kibdelosporangium aridum]SMC47820.1 hypothetical protein SAMN05661093_00073 [Kibdelosporangium aridum]